MKTIKEFFEEVQDESMRKKLLTNLTNRPERLVSDLFEGINSGFGWAGTEEGQDYWSRIYSLKDLNANAILETMESKYLVEKGEAPIRQMFFRDQNNKDRTVEIMLNNNPFNNCQNCAIASFDQLLTTFNDKDFVNILEILYKYSGKKMMTFDVHAKYEDQIKSFFKSKVVFITPYVSTNGSKMIMGLLNIESKVKVI